MATQSMKSRKPRASGLDRCALPLAFLLASACLDGSDGTPVGPYRLLASFSDKNLETAAIVTVDGNISSCTKGFPAGQANWHQIRLGGGDGSPELPDVGRATTVTDKNGVSVRVTRNSERSWSWELLNNGRFTIGIDIAVSKAGNRALIHDYRPDEANQGALSTSSGTGHIVLCYDEDPAARIILRDESSSRVGSSIELTATLELDLDRDGLFGEQNEIVPSGTVVVFSLTNAFGATAAFFNTVPVGQCTANGSGVCSVFISSPTAGQTTVNATATIQPTNSVPIGVTTSGGTLNADTGPQRLTWVAARLQIIGPFLAHIGEFVSFVLVVEVDNGQGFGYELVLGSGLNFSFSTQVRDQSGGGLPPVEILNPPLECGQICIYRVFSPNQTAFVTVTAETSFGVVGVDGIQTTVIASASHVIWYVP